MSRGQPSDRVTDVLYAIVEKRLPAIVGRWEQDGPWDTRLVLPRDYEKLVAERVVTLAHAMADALAAVDSERPVPTTQRLWDSAIFAAHRDGLVFDDSPAYASIRREGREQMLRELPEQLLRAFLVAECPVRRSRLRERPRSFLIEYLQYWLDDPSRHLDIYRDSDAGAGDLYPAAYRSPRELELEAIAADATRSKAERLRALDQLSRIEAKRTADMAGRERQVLGGDVYEGSLKYLEAIRRGRTWRRECRKHGIRYCSECTQRSKRRRQTSSALDARYADLAELTGYGPVALRAPVPPGRPSRLEQQRIRALANVAKALSEDGWSMDAIGTVIQRPSRQRVSDLIKLAV